MAEPAQKLLQDISGLSGSIQEIVNTTAGYGKYQYSTQEALNRAAGRDPYSLTEEEAWKENVSQSVTLSDNYYYTIQELIQATKDAGLTANTIINESTLQGNAVAYWKASQKSGDYLVDLTGNGHDARFGSVGAARVINKGRAKYLRLPGVSGNYASTPDAAPLDIAGDITIDVKVALVDWTPAASTTLVGKYDTVSSRAYGFNVATTGVLQLFTSPDGTSTVVNASTVAVPFADGETGWVRVSLDVDNGAGSKVYKFYTSSDGVAWTQLGTTVTVAGTTSINNSPRILEIGSITGASNLLHGHVYNAKIYNSYLQASSGTPVFNADFTNLADGTTSFTESSSNAATVTINSTSAADTNDPTYLEYTGTKYAYLPGIAGNYISAPDSVPLSITGDITIDVKVALDDWTPAAESMLVSKSAATNTRSFNFFVNTNGTLAFRTSADGALGSMLTNTSVITGLADGATKWLRVSLDADNGSNRICKFYMSDDGEAWTQLGTTITSSVASIHDNDSILEIGAHLTGTALPSAGKFYQAKVYNSYLEDGSGTPVFDWNAANATSPYATMVESSSNAATVTFNRVATGKKLAVVDRTLALFGTDDYLEVQNQANLNFAAADSFTTVVVIRYYGAPGATAIFMKDSSLAGTLGWHNRFNAASKHVFNIHDGTNENEAGGVLDAPTVGTIVSLAGVRNVAADTVASYDNAVLNESETDATTGSLAEANNLRIGATTGTPTNYAAMEIIGAAIFRKALTPAQLTQVKTELGG